MREIVNSKVLAVVLVTGLLFSASSVYLGHAVFADDPWSDIAARQKAAEQNALTKYGGMYQYHNLKGSMRDWTGLTSTQTDENTRGRQIANQTQVALQNAIAAFDNIHVRQLAQIASDNYAGISSTPTDTQGRDRNAMIDQARAVSTVNADDVLSQLVKIQQTYANFAPSTPTDTVATYDRQTMINKNWDDQEAQARDLVNQLALKSQVYVDIDQYLATGNFVYRDGATTNEQTAPGPGGMTHGARVLTPEEAYSLEKALMIFNQIHQQHLAYLKSKYYGLVSTPTDTNGRDRNAMIAQAKDVSMTNALRVYDSYYNGVGLK